MVTPLVQLQLVMVLLLGLLATSPLLLGSDPGPFDSGERVLLRYQSPDQSVAGDHRPWPPR